ncbi:rab-protein geranylgeranyltransferase [Rhizopogon salebrosus TDB-379]|nr:rab-protein geranylgeranyltransferase [Rhizopogon salebrosus TDB-379]
MHHVKRIRQSPEALAEKKLREKSKIEEYLAVTDGVLSRKKKQDWSMDAFQSTQRLLQINPEFYTVWNYRRNILLNGIFPQSTPEEINNILSNELSMTTAALKANPKVYWIWNHRRWCLENVPDGPERNETPSMEWRQANWDKELFVAEKMLDADARNFHAWNYRRYILANMPTRRTETSELAYTSRKIGANFSNFSAWHQRSKSLVVLWESGQLDPVESKDKEFELVSNALYTDPDDQSAWIYHRWLIGSGENKEQLEREIQVITELLQEQPDSKWSMESLVHYKRLLLQNHSPDSQALKQGCVELLSRLMDLDPMRYFRYRDLTRDLGQ